MHYNIIPTALLEILRMLINFSLINSYEGTVESKWKEMLSPALRGVDEGGWWRLRWVSHQGYVNSPWEAYFSSLIYDFSVGISEDLQAWRSWFLVGKLRDHSLQVTKVNQISTGVPKGAEGEGGIGSKEIGKGLSSHQGAGRGGVWWCRTTRGWSWAVLRSLRKQLPITHSTVPCWFSEIPSGRSCAHGRNTL